MKVTIMYRHSWDGGDPANHAPLEVEIFDHCPKCGGRRGSPLKTIDVESDGKYQVDIWVNPCGHIDYPRDVYIESKKIKEDKEGIQCESILTS